jgi:hypothetical protein
VEAETTETATIELGGVPRTQIIADISIMFGNTNLKINNTRQVRFLSGGDHHRATTQEFFSSVAPSAPITLVHSLETTFASGVIATQNQTGYLVFSSKSYPNTFAGMLGWERTLANDLLPVILPWSLPEAQQHMLDPKFSDQLLEGTNIRVLKDPNGHQLVVYGFPDNRTLVICANSEVFLQISKQIKRQISQ